MNNYNYDYMNYVSGANKKYPITTNYLNDPGIMTFMNINKNEDISEPYIGMIRGNMFNNLYEQYKNYKPAEIKPTNEKESLLNQIQMYNFAMTDLNLYLDVYPNDRKALNLSNKYNSLKTQLVNQYENTYGPLTMGGGSNNDNNWNWINSPWPWEDVK